MAFSKPTMAYLTMKGGVGKTTLAANVTRAIADREKQKILLIDADSQCNLSQLFFTPEEMDAVSRNTIYEALAGHKSWGPSDLKDTIYTNPNNGSIIDFIRGSFETFRLAVDASPLIEKKTSQRFKEFIKQAQAEYDIVVIDTNPSATLVTMHALEVSNFLVAPISFDKFSMRGIHLVTTLLSKRYNWLTNPLCVRIVPNRIKRPVTDQEQQRLLDAEKKLKEEFPDLSRSFVPAYIRQSAIISNEERQTRFVAEQKVPNPEHLKGLLGDFDKVAEDILATFRRVFGDAKKEQGSIVTAMQRAYESLFGEPVVRH